MMEAGILRTFKAKVHDSCAIPRVMCGIVPGAIVDSVWIQYCSY